MIDSRAVFSCLILLSGSGTLWPGTFTLRFMEIARPLSPADPVEYTDPQVLLDGEEFSDGVFRSLVFPALGREHVWVQSCLFAGCIFPACVLRSSHFTDVTFRNCDLSNADLSGCSFQRVEFLDCKVVGANLSEATLQHVSFVRSKGGFANFAFGRFRVARFAECILPSAVFDECRFERTEFSRCDLTLAEFRRVRLGGMSLADSEIRGIRVGDVESVELKKLKVTRMQASELARLLGVEIEE